MLLQWRLVVKGGLSVVTQTFRDAEAEDLVRHALTVLGMTGRAASRASNAQFGGAFRASEVAGADLAVEALNGRLGHPVDHARLAARPDQYVTKYVATFPKAAEGSGTSLPERQGAGHDHDSEDSGRPERDAVPARQRGSRSDPGTGHRPSHPRSGNRGITFPGGTFPIRGARTTAFSTRASR